MLESRIKRLNYKKAALLGLGSENFALLKFLAKHEIKCEITVCDQRPKPVLLGKFNEINKLAARAEMPITWQLGPDYNQGLGKFDFLFRSPGWPLFCPGIKEAKAKNKRIELTSPMQLFFDLCPSRNIIGVTGTKGKGTTSSLIASILKQGGKRAWLGGNIGIAPFGFISRIRKNDWVVLELSSFQLEDMDISPRIAVFTNFSPEHLAPADPNNPNYHKSLSAYWKAKTNIFIHQDEKDYAIINSKLKNKIEKLQKRNKILKCNFCYFSKSDLPSKLVGEHNQENVAAAVEAAMLAGIKIEIIKKAVKRFKGLAHRIELAGETVRVKYYDDSFATTPESSIIAMESFDSPIILIAGGADKGSDFSKMARVIKERVKMAVLFAGPGTSRISRELKNIKYPRSRIKTVASMAAAIKKAKTGADPGDIVLLSPGCASFGIFRNYKERGDQFKAGIRKK